MMGEYKYTGGCQCGAVRYGFSSEPRDPHICHCRMCQKAFGNFFAPFLGVKIADLTWTRGAPAYFRSSDVTERGFCPACGTPLTFHYLNTDRISLSLGSLDRPAEVKPGKQYGIEARMPWFAELAGLPGTRTDDDLPADMEIHSLQHPDHD